MYIIPNMGGELMAHKMSEEEIYEEARKRVKAKKDFYVHLAAYICVNTFLIISGHLQQEADSPGLSSC